MKGKMMHTYTIQRRGFLDIYEIEYSASNDLQEAISIAKNEAIENNQYRNIVLRENEYIIVSTSDYYANFYGETILFECDPQGDKIK